MKTNYVYEPKRFFEDLCAKNELALGYFYEKVQPYLRNLCKSYPHLRSETDFIATSVLLTCFDKIDEKKFVYQPEKSPMGYIFKVAQLEVKSAKKTKNEGRVCDLEAADYHAETFSYQPNWEDRDIVANILRQLPKEHRKIFVLRMKGYKDEEIHATHWTSFTHPVSIRVTFNKDKKKLNRLKDFMA